MPASFIGLSKFLFPAAAAFAVRAVEGRIERIEVFGIQVILDHPHRFTEPLEVDDLPFSEESDGVADFRILDQPENVVVGKAGLLFCCNHVRTICEKTRDNERHHPARSSFKEIFKKMAGRSTGATQSEG